MKEKMIQRKMLLMIHIFSIIKRKCRSSNKIYSK